MKKIRLRTIFVFLLAALSGTLLLHTSQHVQQAEEELAVIESDIAREEESIRVLKTEWAYLNNPERLETLARQYLKLEPPVPADLQANGSDIPAKMLLPPENEIQAQPVSLTSRPPSKPAPPAAIKPLPQEKTLDDLIKQISVEGSE